MQKGNLIKITEVLLLLNAAGAVLICDYKLNPYYGYTCNLMWNETISSENLDSQILGEHLEYRNDSSVVQVNGEYDNFGEFPRICDKFTSLNHISCSQCGLEEIADNALSKCLFLSVLLLNQNNFTSIPPKLFQLNVNLKTINLSVNRLNHIKRKTFANLSSLENLVLDNNLIETIYAELFAPLINLKELRLDSNRIKKFFPLTFAFTSKLQVLKLQNNFVKRLNANAFGSMTQLSTLDISGNQLDEVSVRLFEKMPKLYMVFADKNACIDQIIWSVRNISTDVLPRFSECFTRWSLKVFQCTGAASSVTCIINGLENEDFQTTDFILLNEGKTNQDVVKLQATDSIMNILPQAILTKFVNLKHLNFARVELSEISENSFQSCTQLETMDLRMNKIPRLPTKTFTNCLNLKQIILHGNRISAIEAGAFEKLAKLKFLDLSFNQLIEIQSTSFNGVQSLETLLLSGNRIESLGNSLTSLKSLKVLKLNSNDLKALSSDSFKALNALEELDLQNNKLQSLENGILENTSRLRYLNIENNGIISLHSDIFPLSSSLVYLDISRNSVRFIDRNTFQRISNLEFMFSNENVCVNGAFEFKGNLSEFIDKYFADCFVQ